MTIEPKLFQALALRAGLKLYGLRRIRVNSAWTPGKMLATAEQITGRKYLRGEYFKAADDLLEWALAQRKGVHT